MVRLTLEQLEDRLTPATWGNPWPDGQHLTASFAKDGTQVAGQTSELFSTMNKITSTPAWQIEILRALQTWATYANINIGLVGDEGQALGVSGRLQGDERFGDIRFAGVDMSKEVLAIASPFAPTAGTSSGDIKFNTRATFGINQSGRYDLFTVALQETGHALGLAPSDDPTSVMYGKYIGPRTGPSAADIANLQSLYGPRSADKHDGAAGNGSFASASSLTLIKLNDSAYGIGADADVTSAKDADFYRFTAPISGTVQVSINTGGISLLTSKVTLFDSNQRIIESAIDTNPLTGELVIEEILSAGRTYYIKVEGSRSDAFAIGSYRMEVVLVPAQGLLGSLLSNATGLLNGLVSGLINDDQHTDDTFATAALLPDMQTPSRFDYAYQGSISDSTDVDYYEIKAPMAPSGTPNVMTVMVWGLKAGGLRPNIKIYDANQQLVRAEVLVCENGTVVLQIAQAVSGASYFVEVTAENPAGANNVSNYFLGIDFGQVPEKLLTFAKDTLSASNSREGFVLNVKQTKLFHFVLGAGATSNASVRLTIYNQKGAVVGTATAAGGKFASITLTLVPGAYWFCFEALGPSGVPTITYQLRGIDLSDPIGPTTSDPTEDPCGDSQTYTVSDTSQNDGSWGEDWSAHYEEDKYSYEQPYYEPYQG